MCVDSAGLSRPNFFWLLSVAQRIAMSLSNVASQRLPTDESNVCVTAHARVLTIACGNGCACAGVCVDECAPGSCADERRVCIQCNRECAYDCYGPGADACLPMPANVSACRHVQRGSICVCWCCCCYLLSVWVLFTYFCMLLRGCGLPTLLN